MTGSSRPHEGLAGRRIALFSGAYDHIADGVTLTLNRWVAWLERHGAEVLVFAPTAPDPALRHAGTLAPIPSIPVPGRPEYRLALGLGRGLRARLDAFAPDLVHLATPDPVGAQALWLARRRGLPVVSSCHTHFIAYLKYMVPRPERLRLGLEAAGWRYARWFYSGCDHVYVPSTEAAAEMERHGIEGDLRPWPRGVDAACFDPAKRSPDFRRARGIGDEEVVVAFVSRLVWEKGLRVYADVIEGLRARGIPHRALVVGEGPARARLARRLPGAVFTGPLTGEDLARAYAACDVFLFPSDTETFGNVTLEAMASGLPAVCADALGSRALVRDGETGLLVAPGASGAFLDAVARLLADPPLRRRMGEAARKRAETFTWEAAMARIAACYEEILAPPPAGPA